MSADPATPALAGAHWRDLILDGARADLAVERALIDAGLTRTTEGASTLDLTLHDPGFRLLDSDVFSGLVSVQLDGLDFVLAGLQTSASPESVQLTFESAVVNRLRQFDSPRSVRRGQMTRAEFVRSLCREAGVDFYCPQLHTPQPVGTRGEKRAEKDRRREPGFRDGVKLKVKGQTATRSQLDIAERILDVARRENAGPRATLAMVEAAIVENTLSNGQGTGPDRISFGVFQCIPGRSVGVNGTMTREQARDVEYSARSVLLPPGPTSKGGLIKLAREHPDWTPGKLAAVAINGGGDPQYVGKCNGYRAEAAAIIDAYGGGSVAGRDSTSAGGDGAYTFRRGLDGKREDSWSCMRRLADEVKWRAFEVAGRIVFITDDDLLRSRPRMLVTPRTPGVEVQQIRVDRGRPAQELTLTCRAQLWAAPPGTVVELEGFGPASRGKYRRWLVREIRRASLGSAETEITLVVPVPWKPEPRSSSAGGGQAGGEDTTSPDNRLPNTFKGSPVPGQHAHAATHQTSGLPGYPAYDYMAAAGSPCVSPVDGTVTKLSGHDPAAGPPNGPHGPFGWSVYISGGGKSYFLTHMGTRTVKVGDRVRQGEKIGTVGDYAKWGGANHIHMGVHG